MFQLIDKKLFLAGIVAMIVIGCGLYAQSASAQARAWTPGTSYYISEEDASSFIERRFDWAYCSGIPRFGHQGEFPYEEFHVFDCDTKLNGSYCTDWRVRAVKGSRYGYFRLRNVRLGDCF